MAGEEITVEVGPELDRWRADKALHALHPDLSRTRCQRLFAEGLVWRDQEALGQSDKVRSGDWLVFTIPEARILPLRPVDLPLRVIFEDADFIAIDKASGMVVHPGAGTGEDTLVHALLFHCQGQLSGIGGVERPGIVHRLDKETSGVVLAAKTDAGYAGLSRQFVERTLEKEYLALVRGVPLPAQGRIEEPIGRHPVHRQRMTVLAGGRVALSEWRREETFGQWAALLRVRIHTGRTHQIRVHLAHTGHPVVGDDTYGWRPPDGWKWAAQRVMLHASRLVLAHPVHGTKMVLEAPLPGDFSELVENLRRDTVT